MTICRLEKMFALQKELQNRLKVDTDSQEYINIMSLALIDEVMEALRETPWKPWKKQQFYDKTKFKGELIDAWHFMINLSLAAGMDADDIYSEFKKKNETNKARLEEGY